MPTKCRFNLNDGDHHDRGECGQVAVPLLLLLLIACIVEAGVSAWRYATAPKSDDWKALIGFLAKERMVDVEPVLFAPAWSAPYGRAFLGDRLTIAQSMLPDADRFPRVWEVARLGYRHPSLEKLKSIKRQRFGGLEVTLYEQAPVHIGYDFIERLETARVQLVHDDMHECAFRDQRFDCGGSSGYGVGADVIDVKSSLLNCAAVTIGAGKQLLLTFADVPISQSLVLYTGFDRGKEPNVMPGHVSVAVYIGSKSLAKIAHQGRWNWHRQIYSTSQAVGTTQRVRFEISSPDKTPHAFCFRADLRGEGPNVGAQASAALTTLVDPIARSPR